MINNPSFVAKILDLKNKSGLTEMIVNSIKPKFIREAFHILAINYVGLAISDAESQKEEQRIIDDIIGTALAAKRSLHERLDNGDNCQDAGARAEVKINSPS